MKQHKNTCFSSCLQFLDSVSLTQIEKFLHFSFKTVENFSNAKPQHPGQRERAESPGVARGGGGGGMVRLGID